MKTNLRRSSLLFLVIGMVMVVGCNKGTHRATKTNIEDKAQGKAKQIVLYSDIEAVYKERPDDFPFDYHAIESTDGNKIMKQKYFDQNVEDGDFRILFENLLYSWVLDYRGYIVTGNSKECYMIVVINSGQRIKRKLDEIDCQLISVMSDDLLNSKSETEVRSSVSCTDCNNMYIHIDNTQEAYEAVYFGLSDISDTLLNCMNKTVCDSKRLCEYNTDYSATHYQHTSLLEACGNPEISCIEEYCTTGPYGDWDDFMNKCQGDGWMHGLPEQTNIDCTIERKLVRLYMYIDLLADGF